MAAIEPKVLGRSVGDFRGGSSAAPDARPSRTIVLAVTSSNRIAEAVASRMRAAHMQAETTTIWSGSFAGKEVSAYVAFDTSDAHSVNVAGHTFAVPSGTNAVVIRLVVT